VNTAWLSGKPISAWPRLMAANGPDLASLGGGKGFTRGGHCRRRNGEGRARAQRPSRCRQSGRALCETRVGHIVYSSTIDERCRRVLFDNRTGFSGDAGSIMCRRLAPEGEAMPADRLETLSKTFKR
jgi:hypothetical protein